MIGDLVQFACFDKSTITVKVTAIGNNIDGDSDTGSHWCNIKNVLPIPLTAELLVQNGWKKVPQPNCANPYHWELSKYEDDKEDDAYLLYRVKAYETFFRGMLISISRPSCEDISFRKQVEHVHELQHALRNCDIEKEIVIKN